MTRFKGNWLTRATAATVLASLAVVLGLEGHIMQPQVGASLDPSLVPDLYQVAVSSLLQQSSFFSGWSVGLLVAGWYVMVHGLEKAPHPALASGFILVCGLSMISLFLGQMLHEVVIGSIAIGQNPLIDPRSSELLQYQYWTTVLAAALVAVAVTGRMIVAEDIER